MAGVHKIVHFTTVHSRADTRIFLKEATTLAETFSVPVALHVQDGLGSREERPGVSVVDTGVRASSRLARMSVGAWRMYQSVRRARPSVAHFHDPELIPTGLLLKLSGIKVVYDVHEDLPRQIANKHWVPPGLRPSVAVAARTFEWAAGRVFDAIVPATPSIAEHFPVQTSTVVQNFPLPGELLAAEPIPYRQRPQHIAYVGGISRPRGLMEMIEAVSRVDRDGLRLVMAGAFQMAADRPEAERSAGWSKVDFLGWADRQTLAKVLGNSRAGLVLFHPEPNHTSSQPNKLFEYMAAGLPLIASDFPLWRRIVEEVGCGVLVDPLQPSAIADAIQWVLDHPAEAEAMGQRGRAAIESRYNWDIEGAKLVQLYRRLLNEEPLQKAV